MLTRRYSCNLISLTSPRKILVGIVEALRSKDNEARRVVFNQELAKSIFVVKKHELTPLVYQVIDQALPSSERIELAYYNHPI